MSFASANATQQHIERMARGRQQRLQKQLPNAQHSPLLALGDGPVDMFEEGLNRYQRQSAQRMLEDFEASGVDEDLEALKAGWATSFRHRPGMAQPKRPVPADLSRIEQSGSRRDPDRWSLDEDDDDEFDEPRSILAAQGARAQHRLQGLEHLRKLANSEASSASALNFLSPYRQPEVEVRKSFPALANTPSAASKRSQPRRSTLSSATSSKAAPVDPWSDWEARWSQEFSHFEEMERARQHRRHLIEEVEEEAREAEWRAREAEWKRKVETAKAEAARAAASEGATSHQHWMYPSSCSKGF